MNINKKSIKLNKTYNNINLSQKTRKQPALKKLPNN